MKKVFSILAAVLLTASVFAQSPEKMSYQAVIRNSSDALVTNTQIGLEVNIRQGTTSGTVVYTETQTPTTNANGLVSIEIGGGTVVSGNFSTINWANGPYFIETKTDPAGGTNYTITGTSQLLSVPYALYAKTAETVTGGITETDPAVAANFDFTDAANGDLLQFNGTKWVKVTPTYISDYTVTQADVTAHQAALTVTESQISDLGTYIETETDPAVAANFDFTDAANGDLLQFNGTKWVKVTPTYISDYTVTQADVTAHQAALTVTESQISDLGTYIETETDPAVAANFDFTDAANGDLLQFNGTKWVKVTPTYISDYTVTQADVTAHQAALTVTESQISDLGTYIETETDPAVAANFDFTDAANGDLLQFNGTKWVKVTPTYISDYTVTQADVTAHQAALTVTESQISDLGTYIETETDPAVAANFDFTDAANGDLLQFNGTKWVKVTPTYISDYTVTQADVTAHQAALTVTESQISDLGTYIETETDPAVAANFDFTDAANGDLLQFNGTKWVKVTPTYISDYTVTQADVTAHQAALTVTESQISDLGTYIETETDPAVAANFDFTDAANGDLLQFNGTKWVKVTPTYISDYTVTQADVTAHQAALTVTESQISDLGTYIETETDPAVAANFDFTDAANGDLLQFNGTKWVKVTPTYISDYTVTQADVTAHQAALTVTESQISDLGTYIETETDPAVAANFDFTDAANGDLLQFNGTKWVKVTPTYISDYTVTQADVTAHQAALTVTESQISDLGTYIETETDPAVAANFDFTDAANGDLLQFNGTKWVKVTPTYISDYTVTQADVTAHQAALTVTESQISDLGTYIETETDPAVAANFDFTDAANGDLLQFNGTKWVKVTPTYISDYTVTQADVTAHQAALTVTESQISDLGTYIETESDPTVPAHVKAITSDNVSDWNQAHVWGDHSAEGYATKNMNSEKITNLADPTDAQDAATKAYVDAQDAATKAYVDALLARIEALEEKDLLNNGFTDPRDNNHYNVVKIGNQIWMVENLKVTKYNDGIAIPNVTDATAWSELTTGALCDYENTPSNSETYGKLYNWYAVNTGKLCPTGWHVPSDAEWTELTDYLGGTSDAGGKLKETGTTHWNSPNTGATNETGFTALPGGVRFNNGTFYFIGYYGYWWSASEDSTNNAWDRLMYFNNSDVNRSSNSKELGFSVRCLRD